MHTHTAIMAAAALTACVLLTGCGNNPRDRALSGAGIGAGTGAVGAALLDADPITGALIGGGVGAVTGAVTTKKQIDLDRGR